MWPGLRPTYVPSSILIHPAALPQDMGRKLGSVSLWGRGDLGPHLTQCGRGRGLPPAKFHLDPSNRLATIYQHYMNTGQTARQRTDSTGRTVLQTVAKKSTIGYMISSMNIAAIMRRRKLIGQHRSGLWTMSIPRTSSLHPVTPANCIFKLADEKLNRRRRVLTSNVLTN